MGPTPQRDQTARRSRARRDEAEAKAVTPVRARVRRCSSSSVRAWWLCHGFHELQGGVRRVPQRWELLQRPEATREVERSRPVVVDVGVGWAQGLDLKELDSARRESGLQMLDHGSADPSSVMLRVDGHHVDLRGVRAVMLDGDDPDVRPIEGGDDGWADLGHRDVVVDRRWDPEPGREQVEERSTGRPRAARHVLELDQPIDHWWVLEEVSWMYRRVRGVAGKARGRRKCPAHFRGGATQSGASLAGETPR